MNINPRALVLPQHIHEALKAHLIPGDGRESAALLLCTRSSAGAERLLAHEFILVPHQECTIRKRDQLRWPGDYVEASIEAAEQSSASIIAIHSHPGDYFQFSEADNQSDRTLVPALQQANNQLHGTAIMVPSGAIRARLYSSSMDVLPLAQVAVPGDVIRLWWDLEGDAPPPLAFTGAMRSWLKRLSVCVVGVSGTGSIVAEQLARLGFGRIILIDFDVIEEKNLDRILNATAADAANRVPKVEMFARAIRAHHPDTEMIAIQAPIGDVKSIIAAASADFLFSCVDTAEGRHIADRIASYFCLPLFDVGVTIPTRARPDGLRAIAEVCGRIDYVFPGGSTLKDRGVYDAAALEAEYLRSVSPSAYQQRVKEGYLRGLPEQAPSVIALNMRAAADVVMELLARVFPFRHEDNSRYARTIFMLADGDTEYFPESDFERSEELPVAAGLTSPLLGLPGLGKRASEAA